VNGSKIKMVNKNSKREIPKEKSAPHLQKTKALSKKKQRISRKKRLQGIVVSNKMQKTIVVSVERVKKHSKYKKRYKIHKKYKVHDEKEEYKTGDKVIIEECRPISKDKRWRIVKGIK